ncbi:MAG: hypothetical protein JSS77_06195 [Acidobacteria bacterium]|nr:hypothetical protein [Acidobacteriota bacterium]
MKCVLSFSLLLGSLFGLAQISCGQSVEQLIEDANAALAARRVKDAIRSASSAIKLDPKNIGPYRVRARAYLKLVEKEDRPLSQPPLGKEYPKSKDAKYASDDIAAALKLDSKDAAAFALRGCLNSFLNNLEASDDDFERAGNVVKTDSWFKAVYQVTRIRLASGYAIEGSRVRNSVRGHKDDAYRKKVLFEARQLHDRAVELDPTAEYFLRRAYTLEDIGEYESAIEDLGQYIRLNPNDFTGYYRRGLDYSNLGLFSQAVEDLQAALTAFDRFKDIDPAKQTELRTNIAKNLGLAGRFYEALRMFDLALNASRPSYLTYYERGKIYLLIGETEKAEADFRKAFADGGRYEPAEDELRKMGKIP